MATYVYRERCTWESRFEAESDAAAQARVESTWRSPSNSDFDGDSADLFRIETDEDGEFEVGICSFAGENMIEEIGH